MENDDEQVIAPPTEELPTTEALPDDGTLVRGGFLTDVAELALAGVTVEGVKAGAKLAVEKLKPPKQ